MIEAEKVDPLKELTSEQKKIVGHLNDQQLKVALDVYGGSYVEAGPGSGKTNVIVTRTAYMLSKGISPSSILLFTFTKKAANEMKERIINKVGETANLITVSTYHSFAARQLRNFAQYIDREKNFTIYDDTDKNALIKGLLKGFAMGEAVKPSFVAKKISGFKDKYLNPEQARKWVEDKIAKGDWKPAPYDSVILELYPLYQQALKKNNALDFDDLIFNMVYVLENYPLAKQQLLNRYQYITADEVQDSSIVDSRLIFNLMNPTTKNICLVGDTDQAIYGFRGANSDNIYNCAKYLDLKFYNLERNYRSTENIVNAAQGVIEKNTRPEKKIFSKNGSGSKISILECSTPESEAKKVVSTIEKLKVLTKDTEEAVDYKDMLILCRTSAQTRIIEDTLLKQQIPYEITNGTSFYERKEVKDLIAYLQFVSNPNDTMALERIINVPKRNIGNAAWKKIQQFLMTEYQSNGILTLEEVLQKLKTLANSKVRFKNGLLDFIDTVSAIANRSLSAENVAEVLKAVLDNTGYQDYLFSTEEETASDRWENIQELLSIASTHIDIIDFIESMTLNKTTEEEVSNKVRIMTMHGSKGLESRVVFIVGAVEGITPHKMCFLNGGVDEERRLFYVAMTRAKEFLIISYTQFIQKFGTFEKVNPSRFLQEIPPQYVSIRKK